MSVTNISSNHKILAFTGSGQRYRPSILNEERVKLRREAEAVKEVIELKPCQRVNDYVLRISYSLGSIRFGRPIAVWHDLPACDLFHDPVEDEGLHVHLVDVDQAGTDIVQITL